MNKEQIEDIIKDLEKREYEVVLKTYIGNSVSFYCNNHAFTIGYNSVKTVVGVGIRLGVWSVFNQKDVDWLNSITDSWEIYKHCISFSSTVENEQELEKLLVHCVEYF